MSTIKRNVSHLAIGNTIYSICLWLNISAVAKLTNAESVGTYALCMSIMSPAYALLNMNMRSVYVTDVHNDFQFSEYLMSRKIISAVLLAGTVVITLFLQLTDVFLYTLIFIATAKYFESLSDMCYAFYQKHNYMHIIATSQITRGLFGFFSMSVALKLSQNIALGALSLAVAWCLVYFFYDSNRKEYRYDPVEKPHYTGKVSKIIFLSLPLGLILMINLLNSNMPRYFVASWLGKKQMGYFAAISYFLFVGSIAVNATGQAVVGKLSEYYHGAPKKFRSTLCLCLLLSVGVGTAGYFTSLLIGQKVLSLLYTEEYSDYASLLNIIMIGSTPLFISVMLGSGLTATRKYKYQLYLNLPIPFIVAGFCWLYRNSFSLNIAAYSMILAFSVKAVAQFLLVWRLVYLRDKIYELGKN
jgi:O-antigen/teichoic acid export membrane protein